MDIASDIKIREMQVDEYHLFDDLLYAAVYQPDKNNLIPRSVINIPEVRAYIDHFGEKEGDYCLVADYAGKVEGAVWVRKVKSFGYVDDSTPELAISVSEGYRNQGIGSRLLDALINYLSDVGYKQLSLSVQKANDALRLYKRKGFITIRENENDYIMLLDIK